MTQMTEDELKAVLREADRKGMLEIWVNAYLRSLERRGLIESFIDTDGEVYWRSTAKGIAWARNNEAKNA